MHNLRHKLHPDGRLILIDKPIGMTPYECVTKIKVEEYKNTKIGYAGRLDPMASGLLLLLIGDENKKKYYYEKLPKQYTVDVLLGVSTDSADLLGIVNSVQIPKKGFIFPKELLQSFLGSQKMTYPVFSSKRVQGKPLFNHARSETLDSISIPQKLVEIFGIKYVAEFAIASREVIQRVDSEIPSIGGKFRQDEIVAKWHESFDNCPEAAFTCMRIVVDCESGTYMRWLAEVMGKKVNLPALAYNIRRNKIGDFDIKQLD